MRHALLEHSHRQPDNLSAQCVERGPTLPSYQCLPARHALNVRLGLSIQSLMQPFVEDVLLGHIPHFLVSLSASIAQLVITAQGIVHQYVQSVLQTHFLIKGRLLAPNAALEVQLIIVMPFLGSL